MELYYTTIHILIEANEDYATSTLSKALGLSESIKDWGFVSQKVPQWQEYETGYVEGAFIPNAEAQLRSNEILRDVDTRKAKLCQASDFSAIEAGFRVGEPLSYNPRCPNCCLCNALVPRYGVLTCRQCEYTHDGTAEFQAG